MQREISQLIQNMDQYNLFEKTVSGLDTLKEQTKQLNQNYQHLINNQTTSN